MIDFNTFRHTDRNDKFFFVEEEDIKKYGLNIMELLPKMPFFINLSNDYGIDFKDLYNIVFLKLHIQVRNVFEYRIYNGISLVKKNGVYRTIWRNNRQETIYEDVYIYESTHLSVYYNNIVMTYLKDKFPSIFNNPLFNETIRKYPNDIDIKPYYTISDVSHHHNLDDLTMEDIVKLLTNPNEVNALKVVSKFNCSYYSELIFLKLGSIEVQGKNFEYHLYIPRKAILEKDWSLVEDCEVYSIIKPNANEKMGKDPNNWFNGKQKYAPYWNMYYEQYIKPLKELLDSL